TTRVAEHGAFLRAARRRVEQYHRWRGNGSRAGRVGRKEDVPDGFGQEASGTAPSSRDWGRASRLPLSHNYKLVTGTAPANAATRTQLTDSEASFLQVGEFPRRQSRIL